MEEDEKQAAMMLSNVLDFGRFSYNLQEKREESLLNQAGRMITACSVTIAIFLAIMPKTSKSGIIIPFVGLLVSLTFAAMAGWRFKNVWMANIDEFFKDVYDHSENYKTQYQFDWQWKHQISMLHKIKLKTNRIRTLFILISMSAFVCSMILGAIFAIIQ